MSLSLSGPTRAPRRHCLTRVLRLSFALLLPFCILMPTSRLLLGLGGLNLGSVALARGLLTDRGSEVRTTQLAASERWLVLASHLYTTSARIHRARGLVYFQLEDYESAASSLEKAVECNPVDRITRSALGQTYLMLERPYDAERQWLHAGLMESMLDRAIGEGDVYAQAGAYASAEAAYQLAVEIAPSSPRGYYALARFYWARDLDKAESALTYALDLDDSVSCERYWAQGRLNLLRHDWKQATVSLQSAVRMCPDHVWARVHLAQALRNDGLPLAAAHQLERALEVDPLNSYARSLLVEVRRESAEHDNW